MTDSSWDTWVGPSRVPIEHYSWDDMHTCINVHIFIPMTIASVWLLL